MWRSEKATISILYARDNFLQRACSDSARTDTRPQSLSEHEELKARTAVRKEPIRQTGKLGRAQTIRARLLIGEFLLLGEHL